MKVIKKLILFLVLFVPSFVGFGQHAAVDAFAMQIPDAVTQTPGMLAGYIGAQYSASSILFLPTNLSFFSGNSSAKFTDLILPNAYTLTT